jgi:hypothetical protein
LDVPFALLCLRKVDLADLVVGKVLAQLAVPNEDVLLDLRLFDEPLLGVGRLHDSASVPIVDHVHLGKGAEQVPGVHIPFPLV